MVKALLDHVKESKGASECTLYINMVTTKGESALHYAARLNESRIKTMDAELNIQWRLTGTPVLSDKDAGAPSLSARSAAGELPKY